MATRVTLALDRYDRHIPFFLGGLNVPSSVDLVPLEVGMAPPRRHGIDRHGRMLRDREFDAAEVSLCSYIIAKSQGAKFTAVPVFPRRLFSQNHIFVAKDSPITHPSQLAGKRIVCWAFQVTMSVLAKGDMQRDYGLDWRSVKWLTMTKEEVAVPNLPVTQLPAGADPIAMIRNGEADAFIYPHPPHEAMSHRHGVRRLFPDPSAECETHFERYGYLPIMHLLAIKDETVAAVPDLPVILMKLWEEAKAEADDFYHDPGYGLPALQRLGYERQKEKMAEDVWPSGLKANKVNLERFMSDMVDQTLIAQPLPFEQLFHASVLKS